MFCVQQESTSQYKEKYIADLIDKSDETFTSANRDLTTSHTVNYDFQDSSTIITDCVSSTVGGVILCNNQSRHNSIKMDFVIWVLMFITVQRIASFQIRPLKCKPGYRVSSISRVTINGISSYDVECKPFSDNPERIKDITCSDGTVPVCNGTLGGCDQHPDSWIGGVKVVPYEEDSSVEILIPYCCNASNVLVHGDTCGHSRLSSLGRLLTLATKPDEIMQGLSCQGLRCDIEGEELSI
ncbi:hypothetical protein T4E_10798 [Trichinella pseudospiralis]|uniref:Uncharacterized protein n=1 Tax=Trichinella pseudospiralis TaxID=6337 RepID=A0A0V0XUM3_TRIPS|nr:hypothetical protein T4E_10798 [Trichinella pseudospiralis]